MTKDYGVGPGRNRRIAKLERKAAWNQAIREGRVVRFADAHRSYNSAAAAQAVVRACHDDDLEAEIVDPALAQDVQEN